MRRGVILVLLAAVVGGCTTSSSNTYSAQDIGVPLDTSSATVVSSRIVEVKGEPGFVGPVAGGAAGGVIAGASIGSGSGSTVAGVLGALLGAGAGYLAEQQIQSGEGIEYVLEMEDGRTVTLVQNREPEEEPLADGTEVLVQSGSRYTRVLPHPSTDTDAPAGGDWVNPDAPAETDPASPDLAPPVGQQGGQAALPATVGGPSSA